MNEILKLIYKEYLIDSKTRELYNFKRTSWKCLLIINFILMSSFFAVDDSNNFFIRLFQTLFSGTFIGILTYVVTIVIPERMRVKRTIKTIRIDMRSLIYPNLRYPSNLVDPNISQLKTIINCSLLPKLAIIESSLGMISREVGITRCIYCKYDSAFFNEIQVFKENLQDFNKTLDIEPYDEKISISSFNQITELYEQLLKTCKEVEKYYFLDWEEQIKHKKL